MTTTPVSSEKSSPGYQLSHPPAGDEVYITGVSGYFPDSHSVMHLEQNLFNKVDLISDDDRRGKPLAGGLSVIPQRTGKIYNIEKFDASFFGVSSKHAHTMDPMGRILLEKAYEAIIDAGLNPNELRNTKTGVFIGINNNESVNKLLYEKDMKHSEFAIPGCSRSMLANRISTWLGVHGPSYSVDAACSSSLLAFEHAYRAIRGGQCDAAIVCSGNLILSPYVTLGFVRLGVLSPDGRCKSFDNSANGYVRSEAIVACFLQKAKDSRRVYAQLVHAKTNCDGFKEQGITHPISDMQQQLFSEFYEECAVPPSSIEFVEGHGTGTVVGDPEELLALDKVFCAGRSETLLIGSIKSNLGHTEATSGICAIAKMCIAYNSGYIPPNINFKSPRQNIAALREGRMKVVTEKQPWNRGMAGMTSLGLGGVNVHVLLKNVARNKVNNGLPSDDLPRLVCASGRTEAAVARILDVLESRTVDVELIRLLHAIHDKNIDGHAIRGYILLGSTPTNNVTLSRDISYFPGHRRRPVLFVYSGMGAHWASMVTQLFRIPIFAGAIKKCHIILEPKGIDLIKIITTQDPKTFENLLNSFVGITAIHIGLTDILKSISIEPEFIIGHSVGELGCAYTDGCLTAEQTILSAYYCGLAAQESKLVKGHKRKYVGLGYNQIKSICPPELEVACHNGRDSSTISGPADIMKTFVSKLVADGIFVKEANCCASRLIKHLKEVTPFPKKRSARWLSTSNPQSQWEDAQSELCTAEYYTNSLLNPVPIEETLRLIPEDVIIIEIVSPGLLQDILHPTLHKNVINITLTEIDHADNTEILFTALGKLYELGLNPCLANIYPHVPFPVSQGTPYLSHLVEWNHNEDWYVSSIRPQEEITTGERSVRVSVTDADCEYISEHVVNGCNLYPATGYIVLVWETLAMMMGQAYTNVSVVFENVRFERSAHIPKEGSLEFIIIIQKISGQFEIVESGSPIVSGRIYATKNVSQDYHALESDLPQIQPESKGQNLLTKDFYKEMRLRGYQYSGIFQGVIECNVEGTGGRIAWVNNWVTFMDCMLQLTIITQDSRNLFVPTRIEKISIDVDRHYEAISKNLGFQKKSFDVQVFPNFNAIRASGVEFRGLHVKSFTKKEPLDETILQRNEFVANFFHKGTMTMNDIIQANIQIVLENVQTRKVKIVELIDEEYTAFSLDPIIEKFGDVVNNIPLIQADLLVLSENHFEFAPNIIVDNKKITDATNVNLFIGAYLLNRPKILHQVLGTLHNQCFVISREKERINPKVYHDKLDIIAIQQTGEEYIVLFRKRVDAKPAKFVKIVMDDHTFAWINDIKEAMKTGQKIVIYNQGEEVNGLLALVKCLRKEPGGEVIHGFLIADDSGVPPFHPNVELYEKQLNKDLAINVYQNGEWGTYRHFLLDDLDTIDAHHAFVNPTVVGNLSSLKWIEGPIRANEVLQNTENMLIHVYYASLNFRDIMLATGRISSEAHDRLAQEYIVGYEGAGRAVDGTRHMYICNTKGCANMIVADRALSWEFPEDWTFQEAATVPIAYGTVYYAMVVIGELKRGESVLIHAGSGGVGQAAINVALYYGCDIFTTVGTPEKRAILKNLFPQLKDSHIGNSRDTSFEEMVLTETKGKGVDIVLNSLSDEKLLASIRCLGRKGRFVEIGRFDIINDTSLGMHFFDKEISFYSIALNCVLYNEENRHILNTLHDLLQDGISNGTVRPLTYRAFEKDEIEKAFRYMAAGKHTGKVIIKIRDEERPNKGILEPTHMCVKAVPRFLCKKELVFVIVGGLGGFGLELADWLILRGARKILLTSRKGISTGYQSYRLRAWAGYKAEIQVSTHDVTSEFGCEEMLKMATTMGPVEAIFNLAVVLKDALFQNQTPDTFITSFKPKALVTMNLDKVSQKLCPQLKHFVVFSSFCSGYGYAGQTNYALSNSVMERICESRKRRGLPALAIQWGVIGDVGVVADFQVDDIQLGIRGTTQQSISSCLLTLEKFLKQDATIVSSFVVAEKKARGFGYGSIVDAITQIMCIKNLKTISHKMSLTELGMDSIMAQEIKQTLEREFKIFLTTQEISTLSFTRLIELTAEKEVAAAATVAPAAAIINNNLGFKVLMGNIGEEKFAWEPFIYLPTMPDIVVHESQKIMFILPGMEGFAAAMAPLCNRLKVKTCVLQFGVGYDINDTMDTLVDRLYKTMSSQMVTNAPYILLGYSFGCLPMIKLARILESKGYNGQLFCLDGSPNYVYSLIVSTLNVTNESQLQNSLICQTINLVSSKNTITAEIAKKLNEFETFEEKIQYAIEKTPAFTKYSNRFVEAMAKACFNRFKMVKKMGLNQDQEGKLKAPITLLRPKENPFNFIIGDNYDLDKLTDGPVTVYMIEGKHVNILENEDCANTINTIIIDQDTQGSKTPQNAVICIVENDRI